VKCPRCNSELEIDSHEGISYGEVTHYICTNENCEFSKSIWENGEVFEN
jgi:transposase-like protein